MQQLTHPSKLIMTINLLCRRPRTYPFFEDIYPILYHGQKSDIISYPISRQKIEKGYIPYILSNFNLTSKT
jgi:hypothetical protein